MESIIKAIAEAGLGIGSLVIVGYVLISQSARQDKKDEAYISTLAAIQANMSTFQSELSKNWVLTQEIAKATQVTTQILSQLHCVTNLKK